MRSDLRYKSCAFHCDSWLHKGLVVINSILNFSVLNNLHIYFIYFFYYKTFIIFIQVQDLLQLHALWIILAKVPVDVLYYSTEADEQIILKHIFLLPTFSPSICSFSSLFSFLLQTVTRENFVYPMVTVYLSLLHKGFC